MFVKTCLLVLLLPLAVPGMAEPLSSRAAAMSQATAPSGPALTIAELSAQARQKRLAEDSKPAAPPGMTIVPSTAIVTGGAAAAGPESQPAKAPKPVPPPEMLPGLLAIVKTPTGGRYVELADAAGARKYTAGQVMPSGWTIGTIGARSVSLSKPAGQRERQITLSLSNQ